MGKTGKTRKKKQKLCQETSGKLVDEQSSVPSSAPSSDDDSDFDEHAQDIQTSIDVFSLFNRNRDEYFSKPMKIIRTELFPLIEAQKTYHFEQDPVLPPCTIQEMSKILTPSSIQAVIRTAKFLASNLETFKSAMYKPYRRSLHPIVKYHFPREKCERQGSTKDTSADSSDDKISNSISQAFRTREWDAALGALRRFAQDSTESPKLGSLQRWVCNFS